jgi:hypothetical protein
LRALVLGWLDPGDPNQNDRGCRECAACCYDARSARTPEHLLRSERVFSALRTTCEMILDAIPLLE